MKYQILKLDGRYTYRDWFEYCIKFSNRMAIDQGPLNFNNALRWFFEIYGWSAEVRQYDNITKWVSSATMIGRTVNLNKMTHLASSILTDVPEICNTHWSWTNGYDDLRIYVASERELAFFQLAHPLPQ